MLALPAASPAFCVWRAAVCCWRNVLHFASSRQLLGLVVGAPCCRLHSAAIVRLSASGALCCHLRSASSRRLLGLAVGAHCCCLSCTSGRWLCAARALCSRLHSVSGRQLLRVAVGAPCCRLHSAPGRFCVLLLGLFSPRRQDSFFFICTCGSLYIHLVCEGHRKCMCSHPSLYALEVFL